MHQSDDTERRSFEVTCYLDDSGSDENGVLAVIGGPVIPRLLFTFFHLDWDTALTRHNVSGPIHMREFARPDGRLAYLSDDDRRALFSDLVYVITQNKIHSVSASVLQQDFREFFPKSKFKGLFGPAPLAFIWCIVLNYIICENAKKMGRMEYVVAKSDESSQMKEAHRLSEYFEKTRGTDCIGAIKFGSPQQEYALQAADMISWSNRRQKIGKPFNRGFEPLERLTRHIKGSERNFPHFHIDAKRESTQSLADIINAEFPNPPKIGTIKLLLTDEDRKLIEGYRRKL
jgi:hypothetical protein